MQKRDLYWRRTRRLTLLLLAAWFAVTFGVIYFARALSGMTLFGWSFSDYMAAQGTIFIYVLIVGVYAWRMSVLDHLLEGDGAGSGKDGKGGKDSNGGEASGGANGG